MLVPTKCCLWQTHRYLQIARRVKHSLHAWPWLNQYHYNFNCVFIFPVCVCVHARGSPFLWYTETVFLVNWNKIMKIDILKGIRSNVLNFAASGLQYTTCTSLTPFLFLFEKEKSPSLTTSVSSDYSGTDIYTS